MKKIPLTKGKFAIVDDYAYPLVSQFSWFVDADGKPRTNVWDSKRQVPVGVYLSRWLKMALPNQIVLFLNKNVQDCRIENLYVETDDEGKHKREWQQKIHKKGKFLSKYKGVSKKRNTYYAYINKNGIRIRLGTYKNEKDAALAYNKKAEELFGVFATLNKIE